MAPNLASLKRNTLTCLHFVKQVDLYDLLLSGDLSNVVTAVLEVPRRHDAEKIKYYLKWVMW